MDEPIYFYHQNDVPYGPFSNFSNHPIRLQNKVWPTSEHYFQAQKFIDSPKDMADVFHAPSPNQAAKIGRDRKRPLRANWEEIKDDVMKRALYAKFTQHPELTDLLLSTGDSELIENTTYDYYWGIGTKRTGKNMLGILLVQLRTHLRKGLTE